jgi:hypothetical protein
MRKLQDKGRLTTVSYSLSISAHSGAPYRVSHLRQSSGCLAAAEKGEHVNAQSESFASSPSLNAKDAEG